MRIGDVFLENEVFLAPMAGVTDLDLYARNTVVGFYIQR